ncbi:polysaccharide biosynthesis C-terminal domain-containing protein [Anaerococcus jeddahensis]|uniref:polysaccharide biosynthesis C-terminal domain-containing protein n=1 Tax=Anaerococcus jeddahensis TaxID=1673719 RepID=UPI0006726990|nr:polysaccharide biosynthesis C-terminal domain-containing protein [Anaerococcus jeddahensis]
MNRKKLLALNTISSLALQLVSIISGFIVPRLILQSYGSEVNGLINSVTQFLAIIAFLELGVGAVIQSSLYKPLSEKDDEEISKIVVSGQKFFSRLATILLVYVIILIVIYPLVAKSDFGFLYTATMILVISISSFAQYYFGIVNSLLITANQRGYFSFNIQTVTLILNTIACLILIKLGASIHIVKLTTSLIYLLRPILLSLYVKKNYNIDWNVKYSGEPIKQKWNGIAQHVASVILDGTDNIVLTIFMGLEAVSIYSVYNLVVSGVKKLLLSMTNGIQSLMGEMLAKEEFDKLRKFFGWVEWSIHTGTIFIFAVTSVLIVPFVEVYTSGINDANYTQPMFALLIVAANAGHCLRLPYNLMILAGGHYKQTQSNYVVASILNIVFSILLVKFWGLVGIAIGTLIAMLYQTIWMAIYDSKNFIKWPIRNFVKQFLIDFITAIMIILIGKIISINDITWAGWILYAIKVSLIAVVFILLINYIFYKSYIIKMFDKIKR